MLSLAVGKDLRAEVTVRTADGRELTGEVDDRTTVEHLWLRREAERIVLATPIQWSSIEAATMDGRAVEVSTLARSWPQLTSSGPVGLLSEHFQWVVPPESSGVLPAEQRSIPHHPPPPARVVTLEIDAFLVNLDRDVEPDGFSLAIAPIDAHGLSVPVRGNILVRLVGERELKRTGGVRFEQLQRWSEPVRLADFHDGVANYPLRFRTVRPEFDWELIPYALLNVRLGVYGQGNFEATVPVKIREFNPFRDQLQKYERSRFFRDELTDGRGSTAMATALDCLAEDEIPGARREERCSPSAR